MKLGDQNSEQNFKVSRKSNKWISACGANPRIAYYPFASMRPLVSSNGSLGQEDRLWVMVIQVHPITVLFSVQICHSTMPQSSVTTRDTWFELGHVRHLLDMSDDRLTRSACHSMTWWKTMTIISNDLSKVEQAKLPNSDVWDLLK